MRGPRAPAHNLLEERCLATWEIGVFKQSNPPCTRGVPEHPTLPPILRSLALLRFALSDIARCNSNKTQFWLLWTWALYQLLALLSWQHCGSEVRFMRAVAAGASPCHFFWPTWRFSSFCSAFAPSLGLGFHDASTPFCRLGFHDASAPFCRLGFQIRLDCFGLSRLLLVQLLLVHSSTLLLRSSCASARRSCWCVAGAVGSLAAAAAAVGSIAS